MSMADLKAFVKKCADEKSIGAKAKKIGIDNFEGLIKYAGELGFSITKKELESLKAMPKGGDALTDDQLSAISGGVGGSESVLPMTDGDKERIIPFLDPSKW